MTETELKTIISDLGAAAELLQAANQPQLAESARKATDLLATIEVPICRICGCTDSFACEEGCDWVEEDLCSECATGEEALTL